MREHIVSIEMNGSSLGIQWLKSRLAGVLTFVTLLSFGADVASANDFKPVDLGNTKQERMNPAYQKLPKQERDYYENGLPIYDHDGVGGHDKNGNGIRDKGEAPFDRADIAAFCVRYRRGQAPLGATPAPPATEKDFDAIMESLKTCVDDYLEPNIAPQKNGPGIRADDKILGIINQGLTGIGNPMTAAKFTKAGYDGRTGFVCIDHNLFFASVTRELGFPVRELNVPFSKTLKDKTTTYYYQEAATEVFFDGTWYYFDAYETKPPLAADVERDPNGWIGILALGSTVSDRVVHFTSKGTRDYGDFDRGNGDPEGDWEKEDGNSKFPYLKVARAAVFEQEAPGVRIFVTALTAQSTKLRSGWTPDLPGNPVIPDDLNDLLLNSRLTGARLEIPGSAYLPQGIEIPLVEDQPSSSTIVTNDTVTIDNPANDEYCVGVWNTTGNSSDFNVLISTEGGVYIGLPSEITGPPLAPGEVRQVGCGEVMLTD